MRFFALVLLASAILPAQPNAGALVLVNSQAPDYGDFATLIEPYLTHLGVPYEVRDISKPGALAGLDKPALIVIGHRGLDAPRRFFDAKSDAALLTAVRAGTGLVSFDGLFAAWKGRKPEPVYSYTQQIFGLEHRRAADAGAVSIAPHWIANQRPAPREVKLKRAVQVPGVTPSRSVTVFATAANEALGMAAALGHGRAVLFTSYEWIRPDVKGRLYGLDDLVWRSLVWAARKPFVMRGMPKFLAFRVDDVSGFGIGLNAHLGWVKTSNRYGLKPWLGIFIDDMREDAEATATLAQLTREGLATAIPHARRWPKFFYLDEPLKNDEAGRNIAGNPWPDDVMAANFAEAEAFWKQHGIPKSPVALPHFYQFALNNFDDLKKWGAEFSGTVLTPGQGYGSAVPRQGPYLTTEPPRASSAKDPIYLADWLDIPGRPDLARQFFNFVVEIRDVAGYEWAPSGVPVEEAIRRGVVQTQREFDSLVPGVLFTHESDHIRHIKPEDWDRILAGVMDGIKQDKPIPATLDDVCRYLRAIKTSRIAKATAALVQLEGAADVPTKFYLWEESGEGPVSREKEAPAFRKTVVVSLR